MADKIDINIDGMIIDMIDSKEAMALALESISSQEFKDYTSDRSQEFVSGALWGISFGALYANTHVQHYGAKLVDSAPPKMEDDLLLYYPCDYCGSCSIWLAAYEEGTGLETEEKVIEACKRRGCELVGTHVPKEVMRNG